MNRELKKIICVIPVYNDWESFSMLVRAIENTYCTPQKKFVIDIVVINDDSFEEKENNISTGEIQIEIINLKANIGHQRAIAVGLQFVNDTKSNFDYVVVLDSDGEDKPEDLVYLVSKCEDENDQKIIFAQRKKREESFFFKIGYFFYKTIFYLLTGQKINFGNFSCIPKKLLKRLVVQDNLWNHYSGSVIQSKTPFSKVILDRGIRYAGHSKMNFTGLVLHGLSSISVYFDSLSVRILKLSLIGVLVCFLSVVSILYIKFFTESSIPGWASNLILIIFSIILQFSSVTLIVLLMQLSARKNIKSPSDGIYNEFIDSIEILNKV
jgi:hypothetical protein